ncbi:GNAT family N-acetyltransferase [Acerihabitans sp. KWT182]|uniref:GNAT family N-acetyltransferase n=1 Tax=Acerihabitans sp. KWT182 TaxID=3157919 RepID=A0AAU7Q6N5_9GAMM
MALVLRLPTPADYAALALWVADAAECLRWAGPDVPFPLDAKTLPRVLHEPQGARISHVLCQAESPQDPVGFGQCVTKDPGVRHLARIIVRPAARGNGFGRALCEQLMAEAVQKGDVNRITLNVYPDNHNAVALYRALGFIPAEKQPRADMVLMGKDIR